MSQREFLQAFDADAFAGFLDAGLGDAATYVGPGGGEPIPCTVLVDRAAEFFGPVGDVAGRRVVITLMRSQIAGAARGARVTVDGEAFLLDTLDLADESLTRWVVVDG